MTLVSIARKCRRAVALIGSNPDDSVSRRLSLSGVVAAFRTVRRERRSRAIRELRFESSGKTSSRGRELLETCRLVIQQWVSYEISFTEATDRVQTALEVSATSSLAIRDVDQLVRELLSVGIFRGSLSLLKQECERLVNSNSVHNRDAFRAILASIYVDDLQGAKLRLERLSKQRLLGSDKRAALREVAAFLDVCSGAAVGITNAQPVTEFRDSQFYEWASGKDVVFVGPGILTPLAHGSTEDSVVARVAKEGVMKWAYTDPYQGRCNIAYLNSWTQQRLSSPKEFLKSFDFTVFKMQCPFYIWQNNLPGNARYVPLCEGVNSLFMSGSAWMAPIAVFDLLLAPFNNVYVDGIDFFTSPTVLREGNREIIDGKVRDERGSLGREFERCESFAAHNPFINRWIMASMNESKRLKVSDSLFQLLSDSDENYATKLENLYGVTRL